MKKNIDELKEKNNEYILEFEDDYMDLGESVEIEFKEDKLEEESLVFNEWLIELIEDLNDIKKDMEQEYSSIEDEVECNEYGNIEELYTDVLAEYQGILDKYIEHIVNIIDLTIKELPDIFDYENKFRIGRIRKEEILSLLNDCLNDINYLSWTNTSILDDHIIKLEEYVNKSNRQLINERKRKYRRNEKGQTKRDQQKQKKIDIITKLNKQGLSQAQIVRKTGWSKAIVSKYYNLVQRNGKWEEMKKLENIY